VVNFDEEDMLRVVVAERMVGEKGQSEFDAESTPKLNPS